VLQRKPTAKIDLCWLLGTSVRKNRCKIEGEDRHGIKRVNELISISSCLVLLASHLGRGDKALLSQEPIFRNRCAKCSQHSIGVEPIRSRAERPPSRFEDGETNRSPYTSTCVWLYFAIRLNTCQAFLLRLAK
jgi:hypothetical protein